MEIVILIIILIFSIIFHEVAHGWAAYSLGDPTAKYAGRLSLNPIKHIDPIGSILVPGILILTGATFILGWAKPVPINPYNFKDQKYGSLKVALAGPLANISLALIFGLALRFLPELQAIHGLSLMFSYIVFINLILAIFNMMPIPPLDGSHILFAFLPQSAQKIKVFLARYGLFILIFVFFFLFQYVILTVVWLMRLIIGV